MDPAAQKHTAHKKTVYKKMALLFVVIVYAVPSTLSLIFICPWLVLKKKFRHNFLERCGYGKWGSLKVPKKAATSTDLAQPSWPLVWMHAASLGELNGLFPVLSQLKTVLATEQFIITTTSLSGQEELKKRCPEIFSALLPWDHFFFYWNVLRRFRPSLVLIAETEIWPAFLLILRLYNVPVVLFNGRISDRSFPRYYFVRALLAPLFKSFSLLEIVLNIIFSIYKTF